MPDVREGRHRLVRRMTRWYPTRQGALLFSRLMGKIAGRSLHRPLWLNAEPYAGYPAMVLNLASPFQRKVYYFPRAYGAHWMDAPFAHFIEQTLAPGDVFFDIGANIGYYTMIAARRVGSEGAVCAFEPEPVTHESIRRSLAINQIQNVHLIKLALSDSEGELPFYVTDDASHSLVAETKDSRKVLVEESVRTSPMDMWMETTDVNIDWQRVTLLKIDVEGEEVRTVAGMKQFLTRTNKPMIWCEVRGPRGSARAPNTFSAVYDHLAPLGYKAFKWDRRGRREVSVADVIKREDILFSAR